MSLSKLTSFDLKVSNLKLVIFMFVASIILLVGNAVIKFQNLKVLREQEGWVRHTMNVMLMTDSITNGILAAQGSVRGFAVTGQERYLDAYKSAERSVPEGLISLKDSVADNPRQVERFTTVNQKIQETFSQYAQLVALRREEGAQAAAAFIQTGAAHAAIDEILKDLNLIRDVEEKILAERSQASDTGAKALERSIYIASGFSLFILTLAFLFVNRTITMQRKEQERQAHESWVKDSLAELSSATLGVQNVKQFADRLLNFLLLRLQLPVATFYVAEGDKMKCLAAQGGDLSPEQLSDLRPQHGIFSRVIAEKKPIVMNDLPETYLKVASTVGSAPVRSTMTVPVVSQGDVVAVIEIGSSEAFGERELDLFEEMREIFGPSYATALKQEQILALLEQTKLQAEELVTQKEELRASHEELESHADAVVMANAELKKQQEALANTNEELEHQARALEDQKKDLQVKNQELQRAQSDIAAKAAELEQASRYKSEFLANMSHELRTPLNSLLILSTLLAENENKNLTEKQVGFARTINQAGSELLHLINDILDLSRVEAGKLTLSIDKFELSDLRSDLEQLFQPPAQQRGLAFSVDIDQGLPGHIKTDPLRLKQILKNLVSNAVKFTKTGSVKVRVSNSGRADLPIAVSVIDTGVGIPADKFDAIFEEFRQADGSTVREYGGTGLGLAICRKLAHLLGCEITVQSEVGKGSVFTLFVPYDVKAVEQKDTRSGISNIHVPSRHELPFTERSSSYGSPASANVNSTTQLKVLSPGDMPQDIEGDDSVIVVIEDDLRFAQILVQLTQKEGFRCLLTDDGLTGLELVRRHQPKGVLLDIRLPDMSGLSVLDQLKHNPQTRHIPVHVISAFDYSQNALRMGAVGYLTKPAAKEDILAAIRRMSTVETNKLRHLLIIEDDDRQRNAMVELLSEDDVEIVAVETGADALRALDTQKFDCVILDLYLPDIPGFELLSMIQKKEQDQRPPVVVYTGKDLSSAEVEHLQMYAESIIIKGAKSPERLLDEVSLFLHKVEEQLSPSKQEMLSKIRENRAQFVNRRVLVADDDMRNIYALVSALELLGFEVVVGKNGKEAIEKLEQNGNIDMVLMDIMMPVMDGYAAMQAIRETGRFDKLPIIALTAKAMQGDQEKCLEAGANDYLAKPVDLERLVSLLRVWLPEQELA